MNNKLDINFFLTNFILPESLHWLAPEQATTSFMDIQYVTVSYGY